MNSELPPNKILDRRSNVIKISRVKNGINYSNSKLQKLDEKKFNDEKHSNENVERKPELNLLYWNQNNITLINIILSEVSRSKASDLM